MENSPVCIASNPDLPGTKYHEALSETWSLQHRWLPFYALRTRVTDLGRTFSNGILDTSAFFIHDLVRDDAVGPKCPTMIGLWLTVIDNLGSSAEELSYASVVTLLCPKSMISSTKSYFGRLENRVSH